MIKHADGRDVAEFPLTVGVIGAVLAPMLAAVGALAAVLAECTVEVEREVEENAKPQDTAKTGAA